MARSLFSYDPVARHAPGAPYPARLVLALFGIAAVPFLWHGLSWLSEGLDLLAEGRTAGGTLVLLGGALACGAGGGVLLLARQVWRTWNRQIEMAERHPDEPWLWRPEWSTPELRSGDYIGLLRALDRLQERSMRA